MIGTILLVFAFCLATIATIGTFTGPAPAPWYGRFNLVSAALACYFLSLLLVGGHFH